MNLRLCLKIIEEVKEDMSGMPNIPAVCHLFDIDKNPQMPDNNTKQYLNTITDKLLFLSKSSKPNLQESVSLLTKRIRGSDEDN